MGDATVRAKERGCQPSPKPKPSRFNHRPVRSCRGINTLVRLVADYDGLDVDLGAKGRRGILKTVESRRSFLGEQSHRVRFVYTPKHSSWLNQVECWFSILARRVLRRGSFASIEDLEETILDFISYYNRLFAKPFRWTYTGKVLAT